MSFHGMSLKAESEGRFMLMSWLVGVFVLKVSLLLGCVGAGVGIGVVDDDAFCCVLRMSCLRDSGVSSAALIGMSGHVLWKQCGFHDEP